MSKYQVPTMGIYAQMLAEDAVHAVRGEIRTYDGTGKEIWVKDPDINIEKEVELACGEIAHHLFEQIAAANAIEELSGYKPERIVEFAVSFEEWKHKHSSDWQWIYDAVDRWNEEE